MARPQKQGLDYFPFDVDFFTDEKIDAISGEFGVKGELMTIKLLCAVYRNGYFAVWNELLKMKMARQIQSSPDLVEQIVIRLVKWGFFEEGLFDSAKVLTSTAIQTRYFEAIKRRVPKDKDLPYLLVNVYNNPVNVYDNSVNVNINPQSKVKESKVNKSKEYIPPNPLKGELDSFEKDLNNALPDGATPLPPPADAQQRKKVAPKKESEAKLEQRLMQELLDEVPLENKDIFDEWLKHRRLKNKPYRTAKQIKRVLGDLNRLSNGNTKLAEQIIIQAIQQDWSGLFALNTQQQNNGNTSYERGVKNSTRTAFTGKIPTGRGHYEDKI